MGQPVRVGLDAYPDLSFAGVVDQISPIGTQSTLSPKVRTFIVLVLVKTAHPKLMPDLTASLDVELDATSPAALVVPRDAVSHDGSAPTFVRVQRGGRLRAAGRDARRDERPRSRGDARAPEGVPSRANVGRTRNDAALKGRGSAGRRAGRLVAAVARWHRDLAARTGAAPDVTTTVVARGSSSTTSRSAATSGRRTPSC